MSGKAIEDQFRNYGRAAETKDGPEKQRRPQIPSCGQSGQYADCESSKKFHGTQNEDPRSNLAELTRVELKPDNEQKQYYSEGRQKVDCCSVTNQSKTKGPNEHSRHQLADDHGKAKSVEEETDDKRRAYSNSHLE